MSAINEREARQLKFARSLTYPGRRRKPKERVHVSSAFHNENYEDELKARTCVVGLTRGDAVELKVPGVDVKNAHDIPPIIFNGIPFKATPIRRRQSSSSGRRRRRKPGLLEVSSPSNVQHVLHVEWDHQLQAYTGIPDVWTEEIPQSAHRFPTRTLPAHINPGVSDKEKELLNSDENPRGNCLPATKDKIKHLRRRRKSVDDYKAEYFASVDVEYVRKNLDFAELPGNAPGPRVFPGPRARFRQPSHIDKNSILKVSVKNYLAKLGFPDLDKEYRVENLREALLSRLSLPPERLEKDTLARSPYLIKRLVFSYLDAHSYIQACLTCSEMAALIDDPTLWRPLVVMKHKETGFLHQRYPIRHRGWKTSYLAMNKIEREPKYCDNIWNVIVQGDEKIGRQRLVYVLGEALLKRNEKHSIKCIEDDPVIDAVSGIYRFGIDFVTRRVVLEDRIVKLQVWDGGQIGDDAAVLGAAHIVLLLFDITKEESYKNLPTLTRETLEATRNPSRTVKHLLVGNTTDHPEQRQIPYEKSKRFANERGLVYLEANIDNPNEVDKAFVKLSEEVAQIQSVGNQNPSKSSPKSQKQCLIM